MRDPFRKILGVRFYTSDLRGLLDRVPAGGLIVVPSAPVMAKLGGDPAHRKALEGADFAVADSSYMVLLWLLRTGERITRITGLRLLRGLFLRDGLRGRTDTFWVMPNQADSDANLVWLRGQGFDVATENAYVAPIYPAEGPISDSRLVEAVSARHPKYVFIALSGGVQERLGWELRQRLGHTPAILCIGGAIAFLSGQQTKIPVWADRLPLGWLFRFVSNPRSFSAKLKGVHGLIPLIWKYGSESVGEP